MNTYRQPFTGDYPITQQYGEKVTSKFHTGIDYACPEGTELLASCDGIVQQTGKDSTGYGLYIIIRPTGEVKGILYAHLSRIDCVQNQEVAQGDVIGLSGNTGNSTGPHLHFEARAQWDKAASHFHPYALPLLCVDDPTFPQRDTKPALLEAAALTTEQLRVIAPAGAWAHAMDFSSKRLLVNGTLLQNNTQTIQRNGLTFLKCTLPPVWVAVHDGETQILDNT